MDEAQQLLQPGGGPPTVAPRQAQPEVGEVPAAASPEIVVEPASPPTAATPPAAPCEPAPPAAPPSRAEATAAHVRPPAAGRFRRVWKRLVRNIRHRRPWQIGVIGGLAIVGLLAALVFRPGGNGGRPPRAPEAPAERPGTSADDPQAKLVAAEEPFDLPLPEGVDPHDPATRELLLRAVRETRALRLVNSRDPWLPDLQQLRQQIGRPAAPRVDISSRDPRVRVEMLWREGGTLATEAAVARGLAWLARQQHRDGRWQLDGTASSDAVATSAALLPFLGAGQTHVAGHHQQALVEGLRWLVNRQLNDGDLRAGTAGHLGMYAHAQATLVLCEVLLLTGDPQLRVPAQQATDFILGAQYPDGGWGGAPSWELPVAARRGDTSMLGWALMALATARAAGLDVPEDAFELAGHFLDGVQAHDGASYAYQRSQQPTPAMTAAGLLCRLHLGWTRNEPALGDGLRRLLAEHPPSPAEASALYWYHATQVFHHIGGQPWQAWHGPLRDLLVRTQETDGDQAGSWPPQGEFASASGRLYTTVLMICTLEVYYRHLPLLRQIKLD
jgi:hypothetical protein